MHAWTKRFPSPALVVACLALMIALGGSGYAASTLAGTAHSAERGLEPAPGSVVKVLSFEGKFSPYNLVGNNGNTVKPPPLDCRTPLYKAGPDEKAIVQLAATASPAPPVTDVMYVFASVWSGTTWSLLNKEDSAESLQDGTAHATMFVSLPLESGKPYVFGAAFGSNAPVQIAPGYCHGVVTIVKEAL